jgi:hypothetical protein
MMRLFLIMLLAAVVACSTKKESAEEATQETAASDEWAMMDEFHMIMAESFHPYKDSANLAPAKSLAPEMAEVAGRWSESALPEKVNTPEVKASLDQLKNATAAFVTTVEAGDDEAIARELKTLHDLFHGIQDAWYQGDDHGHSHKH